MSERRMTRGERIYYHGRMSLAATVLLAIYGLLGLYLWQPLYILALMFGPIAGWHLGGVIRAHWR